jgi:ribonuclease T2
MRTHSLLACYVFAALACVQLTTKLEAAGARDEFEFFIFRQIWPATSCMFPGANTCSIARNITTWVIHGLWPSKHDAIGPSFCNKSMPFNFNSIKHLLPMLLEFWPNLYTNTPLDSFW